MAESGEVNGRRTIIGSGSKMELGVLFSILAVAVLGLKFIISTNSSLERQQVSMEFFEKTQADTTTELRLIRELLQKQGEALIGQGHVIDAHEKRLDTLEGGKRNGG